LLEKKGNVIIVGDDDQAIYENRNSSPKYLRDLFDNKEFEKFELPFCSRCTNAIVKAVNSVIDVSKSLKNLKGRIDKRFIYFDEDKEKDSIAYPKITAIQLSTAKLIAKYINKAISKITKEEIIESYDKDYQTVLIVGQSHYLKKVHEDLRKFYPEIIFNKRSEVEYKLIDAYRLLLTDDNSNLAWRIIAEIFLDTDVLRDIIIKSLVGTPFKELLEEKFIKLHMQVIDIIKSINKENNNDDILNLLNEKIPDYFIDVYYYFRSIDESQITIDKTKPSIMLTTFKGCKGLSAGHVFIIGANNGSIPKDVTSIKDIDISEFIVALSRTRKSCYVISNKWLISPFAGKKYILPFSKTIFLDFIPKELINDLGYRDLKGLKKLVE